MRVNARESICGYNNIAYQLLCLYLTNPVIGFISTFLVIFTIIDVFASKFVANKVVLDVACGAGYGSNYLITCGAKEVLGVDLSKNAIEYAKNHYSKKNLYFLQGNAVSLPFHNNFFDVVVSFETIEHINEYEKYLEEIKRVLKPRGIFICSTPNIKYTQHPYFHVKEFYPEEFFSLLEKHFGNIERYGQYIGLITRINDVFRVKSRFYGLAGKILSSSPYGEKIKEFLKKRVIKSSKHCYDTDIYEIKDEDTILFIKNEVRPLNKKSRFELLRIMVAVCKNPKRVKTCT